jgi:hypothetical protein
MSKFEVMHYTMVHKALKGDAKAFKVLRDIVEDDPSMLEPLPLVNFIFTRQLDSLTRIRMPRPLQNTADNATRHGAWR